MNELSANYTSAMNWTIEETDCPLCGSKDARETPYRKPPFAVKRCNVCSLSFLSPRLAAKDAQLFYESDVYFSGGDGISGYQDYSVQEDSLRATFKMLLRTLEKRGVCGGSLLEVGCGPGYLLDEAVPYFDHREGIELSPSTAKQAEALTGARIHLSVEDVEARPAYDCIIATHVIEHIYDPVDFLKSLTRRLKPGGNLILAAPHMGSIFRHLMGRRWPSFKYPEHVTFYDTKTLPELFRRAGLEVIEAVPYPHVFPLSLVLSKVGLRAGAWADRVNVTLPATTVCYRARLGERP